MSVKNIIGRQEELAFLKEIWDSKEAEFVAVYGRRRVGKTHLIREYFLKKGVYLEITGLKNGSLQEQLHNFTKCFSSVFYNGLDLNIPTSWDAIFEMLTKEISNIPQSKKVVLFLDELPWLATKRSGLMQNLDYYWNTKWSKLNNFKLIVCGSAASWMLDNLINAKGGLYNRLTNTLLLKPYSLGQVKEFLISRNIKFNNKQILDIYTVIGGIPHYLKRIKKSKSAIQNINDMCFAPDGLLFNEFPRLFASLFENSELNMKIIREIGKARYGVSIKDLVTKVSEKSGGAFSKKLEELEAAGFIQKYIPYGNKKRDRYYRVIDEYTFFYLSWIEPYKDSEIVDSLTNHWQLASQTPAWKSWSGYAFESICYKHISKIRTSLSLDTIHCHIGNWRYAPKKGSSETGAQIDLLIEREDGVVTLCEMKYSNTKISVDKLMAKTLMNKIVTYEKQFPATKQMSIALVTTVGLKKNAWSEDLVNNVVMLDEFF